MPCLVAISGRDVFFSEGKLEEWIWGRESGDGELGGVEGGETVAVMHYTREE